MSELFAKLYAQAVKREQAQLHLAWVLWAELELDDAPRCGRMARGLLALHEDFETEHGGGDAKTYEDRPASPEPAQDPRRAGRERAVAVAVPLKLATPAERRWLETMFRPIFVFTADSHLQRCQWVKRPTLAGDAYHAFASTLEWAAEQNVPVVHGGDLFDVKKPDSEAVTFFQLQLDRFGLRFYFVQGDHDFSTPPWASLAPLATPLHKQCRNIGGLNVCGLDFAPRGAIQADLADVPAATDVLVTHLAWTEAGIGQTDADVADVANATLILSGISIPRGLGRA